MGKLLPAYFPFRFSFHKTEREPVSNVQCAGEEIQYFREYILATGFLPVRFNDANRSGLRGFIHGRLRKDLLWMDLSANDLYGNGFPKNRILD